jgi:hypothetical protein
VHRTYLWDQTCPLSHYVSVRPFLDLYVAVVHQQFQYFHLPFVHRRYFCKNEKKKNEWEKHKKKLFIENVLFISFLIENLLLIDFLFFFLIHIPYFCSCRCGAARLYVGRPPNVFFVL